MYALHVSPSPPFYIHGRVSLSLSISRYIPIIYRTLENDERGHVHEISRSSYVDACTA